MFLRLFELGYALWMCVIADVCVSACVCVCLCARVCLFVYVCACVCLCARANSCLRPLGIYVLAGRNWIISLSS